ncbi:hypothetical protein COOONC_26343, partial [Cooperia oncophora]
MVCQNTAQAQGCYTEMAVQRQGRLDPKWKILYLPGPGDFRPIACLNPYQTALSHASVTDSLGNRSLFGVDNAGCSLCAHNWIKTVSEMLLKHHRELHMLWVDMTKAFDSVSHGAIRWTLKQWDIPLNIQRILWRIMSKQSVRYCGFKSGKAV